jgi:bacterioferritin-associated ferredoxin
MYIIIFYVCICNKFTENENKVSVNLRLEEYVKLQLVL